MVAFWYGPQSVIGLVLRQTNWASVVIGLRQSLTLTQLSLRKRFNSRPIKAHHDDNRLGCVRAGVIPVGPAALPTSSNPATNVAYKPNKA